MATINQYTRKDGTKLWMFRGYIGRDPITGKDITTTRKGFKTKKEAQIVLNQLKVNVNENGLVIKNQMTFKELYDLWLVQYRLTVKPSSVAVARRYCENHVLPAFGHLRLNQITIAYCQNIVNEWYEKYKQYGFLKKETQKILKYGVSIEALESNPMSKINMPRKKEVEEPIKFYTKEELKKFFDFIETICSNKTFTFFRLLAFTGMRKSEVLALQWEDINFEDNTLLIGKTLALDEFNDVIIQKPKTNNSTRKIMLDEITMDYLYKWKTIQVEEIKIINSEHKKSKQFLFTNKRNELYYPQIVNDWLKWIYKRYEKLQHKKISIVQEQFKQFPGHLIGNCTQNDKISNTENELSLLQEILSKKKIKIKKITPHGFRFTHCSLLFESGASIKEVQARLGHKDVQTTMNIYALVTPKMIENTGEKFSNYIGF